MRYLGYEQPVPQTIRFGGEPMLVGDHRLLLDDAGQRQRARRVAARASAALAARGTPEAGPLRKKLELSIKHHGCKGESAFTSLPYVNMQDLFLVPVAHALLYGVVANFFDDIFRKPAKDEEKEFTVAERDIRAIRERSSHITVSSDFGRAYRCIIVHRGGYLLEDWLHFCETFSHYIFRDVTRNGIKSPVLPPPVREMWQHLQAAVGHYFRPLHYKTRADFVAASRAAHESLVQFAKLAERRGFPGHTFSVNLHICICRLRLQEKQRGAVAVDLEFAVERVMQRFKRIAGSHVSARIEAHFAKQLLLGLALDRVARENPSMRTLDDILGIQERKYSGPHYDSDDGSGVLLRGAGIPVSGLRPLEAEEIAEAVGEAANFELDADLQQWVAAERQRGRGAVRRLDKPSLLAALSSKEPAALVFTRAEVNEESLFSAWYGRARTRVSNNVLVVWEEGGVEVPYIAEIKYFVKLPCGVRAAGREVQRPVRLAIASLKRARLEDGCYVTQQGEAGYLRFAIPTSALAAKLEKVIVARSPSEPGISCYMTYLHMTCR
ncbi:hypothetical protein Agub_g3685 [Astrephomene gubernaculifera]|uniref:Uncharacterized protein n=1 Tax=Astrephomene gubernaculifera TaxID=47775 RepID=A0AAD3DLQ1_9CHLO|nr:hypothetical protein Agub_g3685 [Astrephomene gubernaculifera]